ncbi:hypothetical protein [Dyadobacter tibetensis]|uniref:hypothetical protein n=1 Tax=Dyadobacter tibetensis TaxID=1211851 RepID=UPI000470B6FD|nr:hypothetical protein [Dyadobacter tibetensis]
MNISIRIPDFKTVFLLLALQISATNLLAAKRIKIIFKDSDSSRILGKLILSGDTTRTKYTLRLKKRPSHIEHTLLLTGGTCQQPSASTSLISKIVANGHGKVYSKGFILFRGKENIPLNSITDGQHALRIEWENHVSCAVIPRV